MPPGGTLSLGPLRGDQNRLQPSTNKEGEELFFYLYKIDRMHNGFKV